MPDHLRISEGAHPVIDTFPFFNLAENLTEKLPSDFQIHPSDFEHWEFLNSFFSGMALLGGAMFRDFTIVATAMGANLSELRKTGLPGIISLFIGVTVTFFVGGSIGYAMGYTDAVSFTTIGAGACTYIVGPITGAAIGASSDLIAISIAAGVVKTIFVTIITPLVAKKIGLDNPSTAMIFGGMIGTTSGVAAGLAATDPKLVPYGALTATFYTGIGVLLCPSVFYLLMVYLL